MDRKPVVDHPPVEESFEDVGLNDESGRPHAQKDAPAPRKRGLFSRFGDSTNNENQPPHSPTPTDGGLSRFLPGRKRAPSQSGQGAELGSMDRTNQQPEGQEMR